MILRHKRQWGGERRARAWGREGKKSEGRKREGNKKKRNKNSGIQYA